MKHIKETILISLILILSAVLNFANIGIEGYANEFYAAGVKSMLMNFKNFFFASFDPSGFVTIDKPPLGLWIQTMSAKILGFSGWSIILPQALAGVISVWIVYYIVKRSFGSLSGLTAALCLAVTPIFVASSRNNTIDNLLVLFSLLACWAISIAAEEGKFKYLIISLATVGLGFNIKMVEAYMVVPALYTTYIISTKLTFKTKMKHLTIGTVILLVVSLSWAVATDLIPSSDRPYIGGSTNNSVMELILGHNGIQRISLAETSIKIKQDPFGGQGTNPQSSILKLLSNNDISDQIGWLIPFGFIGLIIAAIEEKLKFPFDNKRKLSLLLWSMWLIPEFIYFSLSKNINHTYYLTTMAPSIAALAGIGLSTMWELFKEDSWKAWVLPAAIIINGLTEMLIISYNYNTSNGYKIVFIVTGLISIIFSVVLMLVNNKWSKIVAGVAFTGILIAPSVWSATPLFHQMYGNSPSAGLELFTNNQLNSLIDNENSRLIAFLEAHRKNEKYLVEAPSAITYGSALILKTGEPVMTLGGFNGSDQILTVEQFKKLVTNGELRYAMVTGRTSKEVGISASMGGNKATMDWIRANGKIVPYSEWLDYEDSKNQTAGKGFVGVINDVVLYDLKSNR